nr:hypothetical protein L203_01271 [Cryptococcus depauperatus CBS 7841]
MSISFLEYLPPLRPTTPIDYAVGFLNILFHILVQTAPHTGGWRFFRATVAAPLISAVWLYLAFVPEAVGNYDQWGIPILFVGFIFRTYELLVLFPGETHTHRITMRSPPITDRLKSSSKNTPTTHFIPEQVPAPFTLAKFYWATSLWWSFRGVGWNYCCPLPSSSRRVPYVRGSSRREYFITRLKFLALAYLWYDAMRTIMNLTTARHFFHPNPSLSYQDLSIGQTALYSIIVVSRVWYGLNHSHVTVALFFVGLGGLLGWEGEIWSPWGWPPLFGNFKELWKHPGVSTMWSRTWQGYNRRWLYVFGWIGISENILKLTHTGLSSHPSVPPDTLSSANTPSLSGQVSPNHPLPTTPINLPAKRMTTRLMLQNLIKSIVVFALSGLQHDCGTLHLLRKTHSLKLISWRYVLALSPFFVVQPLALAVEALWKALWRGQKARWCLMWKLHGQPEWLTFTERLLGFIWTWVWLGWSARWFIVGTVRAGAYWSQEGEVYPSIIGGLIYRKWLH